MNIYSIYKFENKINGKCYIGKTKNFKRRYLDHIKNTKSNRQDILYRAIRKYGMINFHVYIIFQSTSDLITEKEFSNIYETALIKEHKSHKSLWGYNMTWGGEGIDSETAKEIQSFRVKEKIHHLLKRDDDTSLTTDRVKSGTHNFLTRPDGTSLQQDKVKNGTHHFLQNKKMILCCNKNGEYKNILTDQYFQQIGLKENWEWVHTLSKEGKRRLGKNPEEHHINGKVSCVDKRGNFIRITKEVYHSQFGPMEDWEWVQVVSKEAKRRKLQLCYN